MKSFELTQEIAAPIDTVWGVLADIEKWPEWTVVQSVKRLDAGPLGVGSQATLNQPELPEATWTVTVWEPPRTFLWEAKQAGITVTAGHTLAETATGTSVKLAVEFHGALAAMVAAMARDTIERHLATEASGLKSRCEGA